MPASSGPDLGAVLRREAQPFRASIVLLDWGTGRLLARTGPEPRAVPGSVVKPLLLDAALQSGTVRPGTQVYCRRNLRLGRRALPCTHPADQVLFTPATALAESCNTWFAALGARLSGEALDSTFSLYRLPHNDLGQADTQARQLATLGLQGVTATPTGLANAFQQLFRKLSPGSAVEEGLRGSVVYGMAHGAAVPGLEILGKTGTASDPGVPWTHGWFAGGVPGRWVVVVYVPHGDGGVAATIAGHLLGQLRTTGSRL